MRRESQGETPSILGFEGEVDQWHTQARLVDGDG